MEGKKKNIGLCYSKLLTQFTISVDFLGLGVKDLVVASVFFPKAQVASLLGRVRRDVYSTTADRRLDHPTAIISCLKMPLLINAAVEVPLDDFRTILISATSNVESLAILFTDDVVCVAGNMDELELLMGFVITLPLADISVRSSIEHVARAFVPQEHDLSIQRSVRHFEFELLAWLLDNNLIDSVLYAD